MIKKGGLKIVESSFHFYFDRLPYCKYTNLLVMVGTYANGPSFKFYYQRGFGYLGATNKKAWCLML
ncbi:hypothetical protein OAJ52_04485, partial [Bacteroidia bacterium]|nr:hypothetical protein [Bacteroidia bacterium]